MVANGSSATIEAISDSAVFLGGEALVWDAPAGYLDTANYGLPPTVVVDAVSEALDLWKTGRSTIDDWIDYCDRARSAFAGLIGADMETVACASHTSQLVGMVASSLPPGSQVLIPTDEFTSNVFPWLVHQERGIEVRSVPLDELASAVSKETTMIAFSLVQSATGAVADVVAIRDAALSVGAQTLVDATQACGWLPVDASLFDCVVCSAYKWLMAPRGCASLSIARERIESLTPTGAGWFAGDDIYGSLYGPPLRLARSARRFDLSPAWICWAGAATAIEAVADAGVEAFHTHDMRLAWTFAERLGLKTPESPIISVPFEADAPLLKERGIVAGHRAGRLRLSFHAHNGLEDVDTAASILIDKGLTRARCAPSL